MELLERYFDTAIATPDGIVKLRKLILTLAMQGKLVPQDPNDPPASKLLDEIEVDKLRLVKEKKIRASKLISKIKPEEVPYVLPKGWEWVRLSECYYSIGNKNNQIQTKDYLEAGMYPVIDQGKAYIAGYSNDRNRLLEIATPVVVFGDHTRNIKHVDFCFIIGADGVKVLSPYEGIYSRYLYYVMQSYDIAHRGYARHFRVLNEELFPLAPIAEQRRIVERIDQLMARCDELEKLQAKREQKLFAAHNSALNNLLTATESDDFREAWQFICQNFGEFYSVDETVVELRRAIIQLAVMGKLARQDPSDPPANELLKEIETEKQRLIKEERIKALKMPSKIKPEEVPYVLPKGWEWVRLASLAISIDYGTSIKTCDDSSKVPVYRMGNIVNGQLVDNNMKYIDSSIDELPRLYLRKNDILFNRTNSYELIGKSAIYLGQDDVATFASYLIRARLVNGYLFPAYFCVAMNAPYFRKTQIEPEIVQQCGQANFNGTKLSATLLPVPPLAEQRRIMTRIDHLMAVCAKLEEKIDTANSKQAAVLSAVMSVV